MSELKNEPPAPGQPGSPEYKKEVERVWREMQTQQDIEDGVLSEPPVIDLVEQPVTPVVDLRKKSAPKTEPPKPEPKPTSKKETGISSGVVIAIVIIIIAIAVYVIVTQNKKNGNGITANG